jgi:general secretion pathway protein C
MLVRFGSFVVWALVAASAVFWGLRLAGSSAAIPASTVSMGEANVLPEVADRFWGRPAAEPQAAMAPVSRPDISARFKLAGVAAPRYAGESGLAVIAVDGRPPRVYRVGASVDGELMLLSVSARAATLSSSRDASNPQSSFVLEVPAQGAAAQRGPVPLPGFTPQVGNGIGPAGGDVLNGMEPPAAGRPVGAAPKQR